MQPTLENTAVQPLTRPRIPEWIRIGLPTNRRFGRTSNLVADLKLHTVCESARCPNQSECWSRGTATFMIAGDRCTRACGFCAVGTAKPLPLDIGEPARVAEAVRRMGLKHVVITAVARDDVADGGAEHFAQTIRAARAACGAELVVEVLTPDFGGRRESVETVLAAQPDVFNHNVETVRRLTPSVRHRATYERSLEVLRMAAEMAPRFAGEGRRIYTKSGLMAGFGETEAEVLETMRELRAAGCEVLTIGQYLQPTMKNLPVVEFVRPETFVRYGRAGLEMGFVHVASGPLVRSSYHADDFEPGK
ncbi:MAG: lipoyl synthase [Verrucomicrobia bacterium]|nr:lipoyl synthase [Verrucomicrobiota bacterium]